MEHHTMNISTLNAISQTRPSKAISPGQTSVVAQDQFQVSAPDLGAIMKKPVLMTQGAGERVSKLDPESLIKNYEEMVWLAGDVNATPELQPGNAARPLPSKSSVTRKSNSTAPMSE